MFRFGKVKYIDAKIRYEHVIRTTRYHEAWKWPNITNAFAQSQILEWFDFLYQQRTPNVYESCGSKTTKCIVSQAKVQNHNLTFKKMHKILWSKLFKTSKILRLPPTSLYTLNFPKTLTLM